ncbi:hypothetical protein HDU89_003668 [Geranomyces variabilis]|nr:hypothetical protein HDU89_003668 [Geranomyces variabilis]
MPRDTSLPRCNYSQRIEPVFLPVDPQAPSTYAYKGYGLHTPGCRTEPVHELLQESCAAQATHTFTFTGDSHTRNLWSSMRARLSGEVFLEHVWTGSWNYGNISASYFQGKRHWLNPLIGKEDEELSDLVKSDIIVMSTGQWPASSRNYGGHWATHEYVLYLKWAIAMLKNRLSYFHDQGWKVPAIVWNGINATPASGAEHLHKFNDWRTNPRLAYWSHLAADLMLNAGFAVLPAFESSLSYLEDSPDGAHFYSTAASDALIDMLWDLSRVC